MISINVEGNLGNQMWQYAVVRTIAETKNYEWKITLKSNNKQILEVFDWWSSGMLGCSADDDTTFTYQENNCITYEHPLVDVKDNTRIKGFLECERYIIHNKQNILKWFAIKDPNLQLLNELQIDSNTCVISYRSGPADWKDSERRLPLSYFVNCMNYIKQQNSKIKFIVVTDNAQQAKESFPDLKVFHGSIKDDFFILTQAEYLILSPSTFSWWGAWLNPNVKITIGPKYWVDYRYLRRKKWFPDNITSSMLYMNEHGEIQNSTYCIAEQAKTISI